MQAASVIGYGSNNEITSIAALIGDNNSVIELSELIDIDGDGIPNYLDVDSDNDGISDLIESNRYELDDSDITATGDNSGSLDYATESVSDPFISNADIKLPDTDGDGVFDYMDVDSDGDGVADWIEAFGAANIAAATNFDANNDFEIDATEAALAIASIGDNNAIYDYTSELQDY